MFQSGHVLKVKPDGNFEIVDKDTKVIYKACTIREFNRYINASDLIEEFIRFVGKLGCRQSQVMNVPLGLFINWLVLRAAESDGEEPPSDVPRLENHPQLPSSRYDKKCLLCRRFIPLSLAIEGFNFCSGLHANEYWNRRHVAPIETSLLLSG